MVATSETMQRQLELGHKTLQKYVQQYQNESHDGLLLSPISTLPELHQELQDLHTTDQCLQVLDQKFLHHHDQLSSQAEAALNHGKSWMNVIPLPQALKSAFVTEKDPTRKKRSAAEAKGKGRELRIKATEPDIDTDENISPIENPVFAILTKIHL